MAAMPDAPRPQKITFGEMRAAAVPRVIRAQDADWPRLRYGIDKAIENGTTGTARYRDALFPPNPLDPF
jgi:hypothetical protein